MNLRELVNSVNKELAATLPELEVTYLTADSREVSPGSVFIAVKGESSDGHQYIDRAISQGAIAVVVNQGSAPAAASVPVIPVPDTRQAQQPLARKFYGDPSHRMFCIGVTGTNGKTSTTYILEHILNHARLQTGVIGTINHHLGSRVWETSHTTPDPITLQKRISEMKEEGAQAIAMEVSSHALTQGRVDGLQFNVAIFTNLTHDHLDYHKTFDNYFQAKQLLFTDLLWQSQKIPLFAVVNRDDEWGRRLRVAGKAGLFTFGRMIGNKPIEADFSFSAAEFSFSGTHLKIETPFGNFQGDVPLIGLHNCYNVIGAIAAAAVIGVQPEQSLRSLGNFPGVPGRLQRVMGTSKHVFVDYAHTPDALEKALSTLQEIRNKTSAQGQIITVFGCGGDRDAQKRPLMARAAEKLSDVVVVTSDNPRSEDPNQILDQIQAGFSPDGRKKVHRETDRRKAIAHAMQLCRPGDVVLVAGKGHEDYQQIGNTKHPFSDLRVVQEVCGERGATP